MYMLELIYRMPCRLNRILHGRQPRILTMGLARPSPFQGKENPTSIWFCLLKNADAKFVGCLLKHRLPWVQSDQNLHNLMNEKAWILALKYRCHSILLLFVKGNGVVHHGDSRWFRLSQPANPVLVVEKRKKNGRRASR